MKNISSLRKMVSTILVIVFMLSFSGCMFFPEEDSFIAPPIIEMKEAEYTTVEVSLGYIENYTTIDATFVPSKYVDISYEASGGKLDTYNVSIKNKVEAGDPIVTLEMGDLRYSIQVEEINKRKLDLRMEMLNNTGATQYDKNLLALDIELSELSLDKYNKQLDFAVLTSPIDGVVTYLTDYKKGDYVPVYTTMARIADMSEVALEYIGSNTSKFNMGDLVTITYDRVDFAGEVINTPATMPLDEAGDSRKAVQISIDGLPDNVRIGDKASVKIVFESREDTIVIQKNIVNTYNGRKYVYVLEDGVRTERDIQLGIESVTQVEVLEGLAVGELIIR